MDFLVVDEDELGDFLRMLLAVLELVYEYI